MYKGSSQWEKVYKPLSFAHRSQLDEVIGCMSKVAVKCLNSSCFTVLDFLPNLRYAYNVSINLHNQRWKYYSLYKTFPIDPKCLFEAVHLCLWRLAHFLLLQFNILCALQMVLPQLKNIDSLGKIATLFSTNMMNTTMNTTMNPAFEIDYIVKTFVCPVRGVPVFIPSAEQLGIPIIPNPVCDDTLLRDLADAGLNFARRFYQITSQQELCV